MAFDVVEAYNKKRKEEEEKKNDSSSTPFDVAERYKLYKYYDSLDTNSVNEDYINTFITDTNNFFGGVEETYKGIDWSNASSVYDSTNNTWQELKNRKDIIDAWLYKNKSRLSEDSYKSFYDTLANIDSSATSILGAFEGTKNYYEANKAYFAKQEKYKELANSEDAMKGWEQYLADQVKVEENKSKTPDWLEAMNRGFITGSDNPFNMAVNNIAYDYRNDDSYKKPSDKWSEEQQRTFGALWLTDKNSAYQFATETNNAINQEIKDKALEEIKQNATSSVGAAFVHSIGAIFAGMTGLADYINDIAQNYGSGDITVNPNVSPFEYSQAVAGAIGNKLNDMYGTLDEDIPIIGGKGVGDLYGLGTSIVQSFVSGKLLGSVGTLINFFGSGAASSVDDALARGADEDQAIGYGILCGLAEGIPEAFAIDKLFKIGDPTTLKSAFISILKQGGVEALEEGSTSLINAFAEQLMLGDKSKYYILVEQYMNEGMSEEEAKRKAWTSYYEDIAYDMIAGGVSGAVHAAPVVAFNTHVANKEASNLYGDVAQDLINETLEVSPEGSKAVLLADKYQQKLDNGKKLSGGELRSLINSNEQTFRTNDLAKMKSATEARLTQLGETGDVSALAEIIVKQASGESLTRSEAKILGNSRYGQRVSNELSPENIKTGGYTSKWATNIGTERINTEAYNNELRQFADEVSGVKTESISDIESSSTTAKSNVIGANYSKGKTTLASTGEEVTIEGISSIKDGEVVVRLNNGEEVNVRDIDFSNESEALVYEAVADMNPETARDLIEGFNQGNLGGGKTISFEGYMRGFNEAYQYGSYGIPVAEMSKHGFSAELSEQQRKIAYNRGKADSISKVKADQSKVDEKKSTVSKKVKKSGKVTYLDGAKPNGAKQKSAVKLIEVLSESIGNNWYVFSSYVKDGRRVYKDIDGKVKPAPNGKYDTATGDIYIDLNAGQSGEGLMIFTMAHELTHFIREWSPAKFKVFADFLLEQYGGKGESVERLIQMKIARAKQNGREISYDTAYEEVIADSCETMLRDSNAIEAIAKLKAKDATIWEKIKSFISKLVAKIRAAYANLNPDSVEGQMVLEMKEAAEQLQSLWTDALVDAGEAYSAINDMVQVDSESESVAPMFSERTWTESEYVQAREEAAEKLAKSLGVSKKKALAYIDDVNSIAKMIADNRTRLDYKASPFGSAFVSNVEYGGSFDFTTLCKKRRIYTGTFSEIQKRLQDTALTPDDILKIRNMLIERGIEATCGLCYVEGSRANMGKFAKEFIRLYKRDNPKAWIPNMADVNTPDGVESMKINHPEAYEQYEYFWNHYGKLKDSDPALFASQQKPKLYESRKEYKGEILKAFKTNSNVEQKNLNGGIRMQSFSDFEIVHMIDTMQIIMDMASVGLAGQAYTKVVEFAETFGNTGLKINLSLIAKGVDKNGKLIFDDREGMAHNEAFRLRDKYSANVGTIIVTFTDAQLLAAMADPRIDFIIPFHRSQWKQEQYGAMGLPKGTKDYTFMQNEKLIEQTYHEYRGKVVKDKASNYMPNEYWDFSKSGKENAEAYLKMCAENNKRPKFYKLLDYDGKGTYSLKKDGSTDGYWKLLIDFKMYDNNGVGSPQNAVTPNFSMKEATHILDEYRGGHQSYPVANDVVDAFVKEYKDETKYSDRDNQGNQLSKEQQEFFKDSKIRDRNGNLLKVYHATDASFTVFDKAKIGSGNGGASFGKGFYFATYRDLAGDYGENMGEYYLNIKNPFEYYTVDKKTIIEMLEKSGHEYDKKFVESYDYDELWDADLIDNFLSDALINENPYAVFSEMVQNAGYDGIWAESEIVTFDSSQAKLTTNEKPTSDPDIRYSDRDLAPTFYSHMGKVVERMKQDKFAANSVVSMLRGRGIKAEEIRWSGIATWLEGKKSVTKQELMEFINGSQLQIGEQMSGKPTFMADDGNIYESESAFKDAAYAIADKQGVARDLVGFRIDAKDDMYAYAFVKNSNEALLQADVEESDGMSPRWSEYKLDGGKNYRELVFTMPNSTYSNRAMKSHWGQDAEGVLAHARIQDFKTASGKKMLFIEEIQSDWHNEGHSKGYSTKEYEDAVESHDKLYNEYKKMDLAFHKYVRSNEFMTDPEDVRKKKHDHLRRKVDTAQKKYLDAEKVVNSLKEKGAGDTPDAPFKDTYHEYVLKRLLRMAAEEGYDCIGWTPAYMQEERWSEDYAEGYRIEYDQDMPKFLKKYGRQWGAKVERLAEGIWQDSEWDTNYEFVTVWSMNITDSMKDSVLHEGQVLYSDRVTDKKTIDFLENQDHVTVYRAMQLIDGKLYPPMNAYTYDKNGKKVLVTPSEIGAWEQSVERPDLIDPKTGKFKLDKGKVDGGKRGTIVPAAYNPYIHTSLSMLNDQFTSAYTRSNLVVVKGVVPKSELTSGYKAEYAKDSVGETEWHSGVVSTQLPESRKVILSRWFKPVEIMDNDVVAQNIKKMLGNTGIEIPYNVVSPKLRRSLEKIGVPIGEGRGIRNLPSKNDVKYSDRDSDSVSNRSLLANALESTAQDDIERNKLKQYKEKIALIEAEERRLTEIREQLFSKNGVDAKTRKDLQFEMKQTSNRINTYDRQLLTLESTSALKKVLEREKRMAYKRAEQKGREALAEYRKKVADDTRKLKADYQQKRKEAVSKIRETREKNDAKEKLQQLVLKTAKWISYPSKDEVKCPDILRKPYAEFLESIDLSSKRKLDGGDPTQNDYRVATAMDSLATAIEQIKIAQDPSKTTDNILDSGYLDLPANFVEKLREMAENAKAMMVGGDYIVNQMNSREIGELYNLIYILNHSIREMSTLYSNLRFAKVEELGDNSITFLDSMGKADGTNTISDFVGWDNALPYYVFQRFGEGGESVFEELMDAQDKLAFNAKRIFEFKEKNWTDKEAKAWGEDTHTIELTNGKKVVLTSAQAMGIYCLSRRGQAVPHLLGGGIRAIGEKKGAKKASDSHTTLSQQDIDIIVKSLTARQKKVAEIIQEFMSTVCADWGNEISMKRFLTNEFKEPFYYPIESNDENLPQKDPQAQQSDLYRLLNISATKPTVKGANNEVIIRNIFDVFTNHASDMARLNAFGMPLLDYMKWLNYREKIPKADGVSFDVRGVVKSMGNTYGDKAKSYVISLIKDINGRSSDGRDNAFLMKLTRSAKTASVGFNLRVMMLQITAYPRAGMVLSAGSLAKGLTKMPNIEKAKKYCGIALWKSFGFYDTNIARSIEDQIKGTKNVRQKLIELSLKGAEWADAITWGALWNACEYEVSKTTKNKVGSEAFYQEVGKKLREVVYATQVVDSTLTRTEIMRNKSGLTQMATAFMSEPSVTANILMNAGFQFHKEKRITGSAKTAWKKTGKVIGKTIGIYSSVALLTALMESVADAWRDDDDEEFVEKFKEAFLENSISNLIPFNKIPIISDFSDAIMSKFGIGFFSTDNMSLTQLSDASNAFEVWVELFNEKTKGENTSKTLYNALYKTVKAISSGMGISWSGLMREVVSLWNNIAGEIDPTLKISNYERSNAELGNLLYEAILNGESKAEQSIREKFKDEDEANKALRNEAKKRYLSEEIDSHTAMQFLIDYCGMDEDEAYWKMQEWEYELENGDTEDYAKYNSFFEAVETGKNLKSVIKEYTDNGVEAKTLASQITSHFKPLYKEMTNAERSRIKGYLLNAYALLGYDRTKKSKDIDKWLEDD